MRRVSGARVLPPSPTLALRVLLDVARAFIVVHKPVQLLSQPGASLGTNGPSVASLLAGRGVEIVHRLDEATSGLLLLPYRGGALSHVARAFASGAVHKVYEAVLDTRACSPSSPLMHADAGTVDAPLGPRGGVPLLQSTRGAAATQRVARTEWRVTERGNGAVRVLLTPRTGRTHQLRVHAAEVLQAPVCGDNLYGASDLAAAPYAAELMQRLHMWGGAPSRGAPPLIPAAAAAYAACAADAAELTARVVAKPPPTLASCPLLQQSTGSALPRMLLHARELAFAAPPEWRWPRAACPAPPPGMAPFAWLPRVDSESGGDSETMTALNSDSSSSLVDMTSDLLWGCRDESARTRCDAHRGSNVDAAAADGGNSTRSAAQGTCRCSGGNCMPQDAGDVYFSIHQEQGTGLGATGPVNTSELRDGRSKEGWATLRMRLATPF